MTREEATEEAHLCIVNDEVLYRTTHNHDGKYIVRTARTLRDWLGDSIPDVPASRIDWTSLHAQLLDGNE